MSNDQGGAVACDHHWQRGYGEPSYCINCGALEKPAAVPVEALEGLVAKWLEDAARLDKSFGPGDMIIACGKRTCADELTTLIKERSNG